MLLLQATAKYPSLHRLAMTWPLLLREAFHGDRIRRESSPSLSAAAARTPWRHLLWWRRGQREVVKRLPVSQAGNRRGSFSESCCRFLAACRWRLAWQQRLCRRLLCSRGGINNNSGASKTTIAEKVYTCTAQEKKQKNKTMPKATCWDFFYVYEEPNPTVKKKKIVKLSPENAFDKSWYFQVHRCGPNAE